MISIIKPPTPEILALCDAIDRVVGAYLDAFGQGKIKLERFEAELEAYVLHKLIIRHAEAFVLMARHDLVFLPSANVVARAAFEAHLKIMWLLKPVDPYEQETRWVMHLISAVDHWSKLSKAEHIGEDFRAKLLERKNAVETFATNIGKLLDKEGYKVPNKAVTLWDILKDLDQKHLYPAYIHFSAYSHTNYEAASLYRKNLGCAKELGEFIEPKDWAFAIEAVWKSLFVASRRVLALVECPLGAFSQKTLNDEFQHKLLALTEAHQ
jgi:hypothetical protein